VLQKIQSLYSSGDFGLCCILILPLLETVFRKIFVILNDCPERMLTAEAECLYTTFNEIFDEHLENGELNNVQKFLGEDLVLLMFDLLTFPEGPRIRDKLSHGEVFFSLDSNERDSNIIMKTVAQHLLTVLVNILSKANRKSIIDICHSADSSYTVQTYRDYKSVFHPTTLLINSLIDNLNQINKISLLKIPSSMDLIQLKSEDIDESVIILIQQCLRKDVKSLDSDCLTHFEQCMRYYRGACLYRSRQEYEILTLLQKVSDQISIASNRTVENLKEKMDLFGSNEMRSRQRVTFKKMLEIVPLVQREMSVTVIFIYHILQEKEQASLFEHKKHESHVKYVKKILKDCENISANVQSHKNKWEEVDKLINSLHSLIVGYRNKFS